ncbi:TonB-dependent receptor domain-containing protein [Bacteroidota bacterium]
MRKYFILFCLLTGLVLHAQDNSAVIKGYIYDAKSNLALQSVNVIYKNRQGTITNKDGFFTIKTEAGEFDLSFQYVGYQTQRKSVLVQINDTLELSIGLQTSINELEEIVFSANKTEHKISESTVSMEIIKPKTISKNHIANAGEIIRQTPGIEILDGQASIRGGSGWSYGAGSRVLLLIDGLTMLSADAGDAKWDFLPVENLSQIEIIKGASSVLYGSSALNGIINFITAEAKNDPLTKISLNAGVYDNPRQKNWIWSDSPRLFSNATFFHSKKHGNTSIGLGSSVIYDQGYRKQNDKKSGRLNFNLKHNSKRYKSLSYGLNLNSMFANKTDFLIWKDADSSALIQTDASAMELNQTIFSADPFISINKNNRAKHDLKMRFYTTQNRHPDDEHNNSNAFLYLAEYKFWYRIYDNLSITLGLSQQYKVVKSEFYKDHNGYNIGGYSQMNYRPVNRLKIIAGVRFEQNFLDGLADDIKPIFRTGVNYKAAEYTFIRAAFGQGYRFPSVAEKHAFTTVGSVKVFPNPEIMPEEGWSTELGIKQGVNFKGWKGQVDLSLFYSQNKNLIEYVFGFYQSPVTDSIDAAFKPMNIENSRVPGVELEIMAQRNFGEISTSISGGYTFIYPEEFNEFTGKSTGVFLKYRNQHSVKIMTSTSYRKYEIGINILYNSKMLDIDDVFVNPYTRETILPGFYSYWTNNNDGYLITDLHLAYNFTPKTSFSVAVKNLFNVEYMGRPGDILPMRSFSIQFSKRF